MVPVETDGSTLRGLGTLSLTAIGGALVESGVPDEEGHERIVADAREVEEEDRDRLLATCTVYSAWGTV